MSSCFLPVKMSIPIKRTLACPCFPGLDVDISTILHDLTRMVFDHHMTSLAQRRALGRVGQGSSSISSSAKILNFYPVPNSVGAFFND